MDQGLPARSGRVLALRALGLGDLLVAVPALKALRAAMPSRPLLLAAPAWLADVVALIPAVDQHLPVAGLDGPLAVDDVDIAVNLHGDGRESAALLGSVRPRWTIAHASPGRPGLVWRPELHERVRWVRLLEAHGMPGDPVRVSIDRPATPSPAPGAVVLHVGAAYGSRRWPVDRFAEVARALAADRPVVFSGSAGERPRALAVAELAGLPDPAVLAGSMPLAGFAALIADASLVVTADTGAGHLASAFGTPSVVIYGPASPDQWGPPPGPHVALTDASVRVGDVFGDDPDPALLAVSSADVLRAARQLPLVVASGVG